MVDSDFHNKQKSDLSDTLKKCKKGQKIMEIFYLVL